MAFREGSPQALLDRKGTVTSVESVSLGGDSISTWQELHIRSSTGLNLRALVRVPLRQTVTRHPGAVLVGGINRGRRIAITSGIDRVARHAVVISFDYPIRLRRSSWAVTNLVSTLPRVRMAAFDTVAATLLALDYLAARPDVDAQRIFLIGGSMGAEVVTVAGGVDPRAAAVVALYGGGRLGPLISHTLEHPAQRHPYPHWKALMAGHALAWLLTPLEPARYASGIAPRPFLMVNGSEDSLIPAANVLALEHAARPPKELVWVRGEHVEPDATALLHRLSGIVTAWLVQRGLLPGDFR